MKRKLKTIQKILEQQTADAYFDSNGDLMLLDASLDVNSVNRKMFCFFGKEVDTDDKDFNEWTWDGSFFEPEPEKKKIYFYKDTMSFNPRALVVEERMDHKSFIYLGSITLDVE